MQEPNRKLLISNRYFMQFFCATGLFYPTLNSVAQNFGFFSLLHDPRLLRKLDLPRLFMIGRIVEDIFCSPTSGIVFT